jgi:RimJ/RimL family protein N-acetyltransferase
MRPPYLTGVTIYLRALVSDDRDNPVAWHDSPFPINGEYADELLQEMHQNPWQPMSLSLAVVRREDEEVIGGVTVNWPGRRVATFRVHLAPTVANPDALRAEVLRLAIPWLRDETELMTVTVSIPADNAKSIAAAEGLGMTPAVRLREAIARPEGWVDLMTYQALNPRWAVAEADRNA